MRIKWSHFAFAPNRHPIWSNSSNWPLRSDKWLVFMVVFVYDGSQSIVFMHKIWNTRGIRFRIHRYGRGFAENFEVVTQNAMRREEVERRFPPKDGKTEKTFKTKAMEIVYGLSARGDPSNAFMFLTTFQLHQLFIQNHLMDREGRSWSGHRTSFDWYSFCCSVRRLRSLA